ncbi:PQQ-dependent sugar dehydrogenase [Arenimonas sp.]|jgi:glucose/arabinose dehydrogenase|uniref:PQQ-dependent sugar dehydrogenase n=1 Tax=Arenimonas sp. TaxID=1872635 RepID=UPI0037C000E7
MAYRTLHWRGLGLAVLCVPGLAAAQKTQLLKSSDYTLQLTELNAGLKSPWGMAFLPDGRLLVTQKSGSIALLSRDGGRIEQTITGLPRVASQGQGGLLDVALDPDFARTSWLYWSYAEPGEGGVSGTAVARAKLINGRLQSTEIIYRQIPKVEGAGHFGSRLVFGRDKSLFITLGDRQKFTPAQDMTQTIGKVVRVQRDGRIPADNPVWKATGARPEIYSLGHRNPQGAALHPGTGVLWLSEHGPQGGDEINRVQAGKNYGWPTASYGCHYGEPVGEECRLGGGKHSPKFVEPLSIWVPRSIAPSGMLFYTGPVFPKWRNHILMGSLAGTALWRIQFDGDKEVRRERLLGELGERIRDVEQGPDGLVYLLADSGKLLRISPTPEKP